MNRGQDMQMFGCTVKNFVTPEFSRFRYPELVKNYQEVVALVRAKSDVFKI